MSSRAIKAVSGRIYGRATARRYAGRAERESMVVVPPNSYIYLLRLLASDCNSVLDVGTGLMRSLGSLPCQIKIGLDAHRPYLEHREIDNAVPLNASALEIERLFVSDSVELVTLIDVLEHFSREDALEVMRQVEQAASRRVVIFTPRGEFPQEEHDAFGLGGEDFQRHRSAWEPEELTTLGYRVAVLESFHDWRNESFVNAFGRDAPPVDALLAWKTVKN